jgi:hypothetical protein
VDAGELSGPQIRTTILPLFWLDSISGLDLLLFDIERARSNLFNTVGEIINLIEYNPGRRDSGVSRAGNSETPGARIFS